MTDTPFPTLRPKAITALFIQADGPHPLACARVMPRIFGRLLRRMIGVALVEGDGRLGPAAPRIAATRRGPDHPPLSRPPLAGQADPS